MKKRYILLPGAMLAAVLLLTGAGAVAKYKVLAPLGLAEGVDAAGLPFRLATDENLKAEIDFMRQQTAQPETPEEPEQVTHHTPARLPSGPSHSPRPAPDPGLSSAVGSSAVDDPDTTGDPTPPPESGPGTVEQNSGDPAPQDPAPPAPPEEPPVEEPDPQPPTEEPPVEEPKPPIEDPAPDPQPADPEPPVQEPPAQEPPAQDPEPPAPEDPPVSTEAPEASDEYTIVTGTGGEFTPGAMVDDSWFDDALFIGDSRTDGLRLYCRVGQADYFAVTGLTVYSALTKKASDKNFSSQTLGNLLDSKTYGKIFICLGLNECGGKVQNIINSYQNVINTIQTKQPGAVVIVQGVMCCGRKKAANSPSFGPKNINRLNANIKTMAAGSGAYYIDPNTLFADSEGYLPDKFSGDGCHFYAKYYSVWVDWMKCAVYNIPVGGAAPEEPPEETAPTEPTEPTELTEPTDTAPPEDPGAGTP